VPDTDLRPAPSLQLRGRRWSHWTFQYAFHRGREFFHRILHPDEPSFTPDAIRRLEQILRPADVGAEWGSGNSTRWLARRTRHLTSFETSREYAERVRAALRQEALSNVELRVVSFAEERDEEAMHQTAWVRSVDGFDDESLDYVVVDSSPRGCLCLAAAAKLKAGGVLVLDDAHWYMVPPADVTAAPDAVRQPLGTPGSRLPTHRCWPAFAALTANWRRIWTSSGVQMTLLLFKP
jgi:SAM-dependent methyltransferase